MRVWVRAVTLRVAVIAGRLARWLRRCDAAVLPALVATRRRRRALAVGVLLVTSPAWAAGGAVLPRPVPPPPVPPALVAAITSARPVGYPVGGIDISSHDHRHYQECRGGWTMLLYQFVHHCDGVRCDPQHEAAKPARADGCVVIATE